MIRLIANKALFASADGYTVKRVQPGEPFDVADRVAPGLIEAGDAVLEGGPASEPEPDEDPAPKPRGRPRKV